MEENNFQSFKFWKPQDVKKIFKVTPSNDNPALEEWLNTDCVISAEEKKQLELLRSRLVKKVQDWSEETLSFLFLGPLMHLIWFESEQYSAFRDAKLAVKVGDQMLQGKVDFMVAAGEQTPTAPFFTLHEYKPEMGYTGYPLGQLLIAMVAAQKRNEAVGIDVPLYGSYVMGRFFFFVYFYKNQYAQSLAYDATQKDLFKIYCIIKKVKDYIETNLEKM